MDEAKLRDLLVRVQSGAANVDEAVSALRTLPFEDLGFARVDHHRALRSGFPEVIYAPGKTTPQIIAIAERLLTQSGKVLATRVAPDVANVILQAFPDAVYHALARIVVWGKSAPDANGTTHGTVLIVSAGTADLPVAEEAAVTVSELGSPVERLYDVGVAGIHRLLEQTERIRAAHVVVVVAGMEGALASVVGGLVSRPIVAVPTSVGYGANFGGLSALLTMLNSCATGVGVVNIDNGFGAGVLAHRINSVPAV